MTDATPPVAWASRSWLANPIGGNFTTAPHPSFDVPLYDQAALDAAVAAALERSRWYDDALIAAERERVRSAIEAFPHWLGQQAKKELLEALYGPNAVLTGPGNGECRDGSG